MHFSGTKIIDIVPRYSLVDLIYISFPSSIHESSPVSLGREAENLHPSWPSLHFDHVVSPLFAASCTMVLWLKYSERYFIRQHENWEHLFVTWRQNFLALENFWINLRKGWCHFKGQLPSGFLRSMLSEINLEKLILKSQMGTSIMNCTDKSIYFHCYLPVRSKSEC